MWSLVALALSLLLSRRSLTVIQHLPGCSHEIVSTTTKPTTTALRSSIKKNEQGAEIPAELASFLNITSTTSTATKLELLKSDGFCNALYLVPNAGLILKVYSDLAQDRMASSCIPVGSIDKAMADRNLAPKIIASSSNGILMEYLEHTCCLQISDLHGSDNKMIPAIARSLADLHYSIPLPDNAPNMLWSSLQVLLNRIENPTEQAYYRSQIEQQHAKLSSLNLPTVCGHGDFKPSNILIDENNKKVYFIDLETAGNHYRAYDLAKLFRQPTMTSYSHANQRLFLEFYLDRVDDICMLKNNQTEKTGTTPELLKLESDLLLPMTWLEAAIFFEASGKFFSQAQDRKENYEKECRLFPKAAKLYQRAMAKQATTTNSS